MKFRKYAFTRDRPQISMVPMSKSRVLSVLRMKLMSRTVQASEWMRTNDERPRISWIVGVCLRKVTPMMRLKKPVAQYGSICFDNSSDIGGSLA